MVRVLLILISLISLSACAEGRFQKVMGIKRPVPDEFKVVSNPPLNMPPEFSLKPPSTTSKLSSRSNVAEKTKEALFGTSFNENSNLTSSEEFFVSRTNAKKPVENIRQVIDAEETQKEQAEMKRPFFEKVLEYANLNKDQEPIVDASEEKERIIMAEENGEQITGEGTPIAVEDNGLLNKVFGH